MNNQINMDKSATRVTITMNGMPSSELIELEQQAIAWLKEHAPSLASA